MLITKNIIRRLVSNLPLQNLVRYDSVFRYWGGTYLSRQLYSRPPVLKMPRPNRKSDPASAAASTTLQAEDRRPRPSRRASTKVVSYLDQPSPTDPEVLDSEIALRASPTDAADHALSPDFVVEGSEQEVEEEEDIQPKKRTSKTSTKSKTKPLKSPKKVNGEKPLSSGLASAGKKRKAAEAAEDKDFVVENDEDAESVERPPAVNHDYRPFPFKGRLGFACLNTYLRLSNPPIFCSRTCRIDTILKHDKESGAGGGMAYVKSLGYTNANDLSTLIRWNQKYGIKFLRISSEMFPFASHAEYGYTLEHAAEPLAKAGKLAMEYGHRLTMHPGQFTQLGSPRKEVVEAAIRDLEYHCELMDRLQLKGQADRDGVMIIHMGGTFGDKAATLDRFREVYTTRLSEGIKRRLVLENDDVCYSVDDLLEICQELKIPLVLDWHHNNIIHGNLREGTYDIKETYGEAIKKTWTDKGITQKQHYSEPRTELGSKMERRRHSARVFDFPPCDDTMDLMIEAKDKEQAVFELMKKFKVDGWDKIGDVIPYERTDENKEVKKKKKGEEEIVVALVPNDEIGMGGPDNRVYWPEGLEEYLRPRKKVRVKKEENEETESKPKASPKKGRAKSTILPEFDELKDTSAPKKSRKKIIPKQETESSDLPNGDVQEPPPKKRSTGKAKSKVAEVLASNHTKTVVNGSKSVSSTKNNVNTVALSEVTATKKRKTTGTKVTNIDTIEAPSNDSGRRRSGRSKK